MRLIPVILLIAATANGQVVFVDSRIGDNANDYGLVTIDLADKSRMTNPDLYDWTTVRQHPTPSTVPSLADPLTGVSVTITGTIAQAQADLTRAVSNTYPATVRLKGVDRSQYAESGRTNSNNGAASMRVDLTKLFEMVAEINERLERLEAR